jgi:lysozyme family protein
MSSNFGRAFAAIVGHEGVLSLDPQDRGNWTGGRQGAGVLRGTKFGISAAAYPELDIQAVSIDQAREIYARDYWRPVHAEVMPWPVALVVFDLAVNSGVRFAAQTLQRALRGVADGSIGPVTLAALGRADPFDVAAEVLAQRHYQMTAMEGWSRNGLGWTRRVFRLAFQAAA